MEPTKRQVEATRATQPVTDYYPVLESTSVLRVFTWNVWTEQRSRYVKERMVYICRLIKREGFDIVSLLDVSEEALTILSDQLSKLYHIFQVFKKTEDKTGTVVLCNKESLEFTKGEGPYYYDFQKSSNVLGAALTHKATGFEFNCLATRLSDNPDNDHIREKQAETVAKVIKNMPQTILMGDMNIYDIKEPAEATLSFLSDSWVNMLCPNNVKYTFDGLSNNLISTDRRMRNSRVLYHSKGKAIEPRFVSLHGQGLVSDININPSLYYGLEVNFVLRPRL